MQELQKSLMNRCAGISPQKVKQIVVTLDALASICVQQRGQVFAVALQLKDYGATIWLSGSRLKRHLVGAAQTRSDSQQQGGKGKAEPILIAKEHLMRVLDILRTLRAKATTAAAVTEGREDTPPLVSVSFDESKDLYVQVYTNCSDYL